MKTAFAGGLILIGGILGLNSSAFATCAVFGDSIGLGLGRALQGACPTSAEIGILSSIVAARVTAGARWTIVSLGSNDFPKGLAPQMKILSERRVIKALEDVRAKAGSRLILIVPANEARSVVEKWASEHGVSSITFEAGQDGIHPRSQAYADMAREVRRRVAN